MTYEGYFVDYPDDEELPEASIEVEDAVDPSDETVDEMAHRKRVFERMVLEYILEEHGEEWAAIAEYFATQSMGEGFWNDPIIYQDDWDKELAERVGDRFMEVEQDTENDMDRDYILEQAGVA